MTDSSQGSTWAVYGRLLRFVRPYAGRLSIGILAGLVSGGSVFGILGAARSSFVAFDPPAAAVETLDATAEEAPADHELRKLEAMAANFGIEVRQADGRMTWRFMMLAMLGVPIFMVLRGGATYLNRYYMCWVGSRTVRDLRDALFAGLQSQSLSFFGRCDVGRLISRSTNDTQVVEMVVSTTAAEAARAPAEILAALGYVISFAYEEGLLGLVAFMCLLFPLCIVPIVLVGRYIRRHMRRALDRISSLVSRMHENFTGIKVVKAFDMEARETERFVELNRHYFRTTIKVLRAELLMTPLMEVVAVLLGCAFLVICYARGVKLSQLFPIAFAGIFIYRPLKQLARLNANVQRGGAALDNLFAILDLDTALREAPNPVTIDGFEDSIVFSDVTFGYDAGGDPVLSDISVTIPKGSVVAVVGETGSGKSTMANLLARFYDPTSGVITLDGVDLREISISSLRRLIGVVTQDTILFNDTIATNICYGTPDATREQIESAARQANAHEFIVAHPDGYERVVGEKGFVLSGGEKQRVAIARAILKNPPILILDEATSALDTVTERLVQEAIAHVMANRTVFAIAHRLSTVRHADQILLIDAGRIVERGTHDELHRAGSRYRKLCDMQVMDSL